ncbi:MAG: hypothetical protein ACYS47_21080, partial [Planctomycetota bacterium]
MALSKILTHPDVLKAAESYVRILIRVPEAYLLLPFYGVTRPGLMVVDADGRKVSFLKLVAGQGGSEPEKVAEWLAESLKGKPRERFTFRITSALDDAEKDFLGTLGKIEGVHAVEMKRGTVVVTADPGILTPEKLLAPVEERGLALLLLDPVPVRFEARELSGEEDGRPDFDGVPGVWSLGKGDRPRAL